VRVLCSRLLSERNLGPAKEKRKQAGESRSSNWQ
jgi:hypothetical protein